MFGLPILLAAGLVVALLAMVGWTVRTLTHPPRRTYASAVARGRPGTPGELPGGPRAFEEWTFRTGDLELPVWDMPGDDPAGPVVILSHGWGDSRVGALSRIAALAPMASRLIAWDMRGHGDAPGHCCLGTREVDDLLVLIERVGSERRIVLYGWSLGAGVSIAAAGRGVAGVVAEAPYRLGRTPARNVLELWGLPHRVTLSPALWIVALRLGLSPRVFASPSFDRAELAKGLACPLLVLHGEEDEVSPVVDGRAIARAAQRGELRVLAGAGHHGLWTEPGTAEQCTKIVSEWMAGLPR